MSLLFLLGPAFAICVLLTGIHCYLGIHVLSRKVVFVDLALAQSAAFGLAVSLLLGWAPDSLKSYLLILSSALGASVLLTLLAGYKKQIYEEAFIGLVYAFFSVLVILLLDKSPHGAEQLKQTLTGHLIWTNWGEVLKMLLIYAAVSVVYFTVHKKLWENSQKRNRDWKWDFLFYALFSVVITSSVIVAGVLLVFSFLVAPAFLSCFLFKGFRSRLLFGWGLGLLLSLTGLAGSYIFNLPTSPFLIFLFTCLPIVFVSGQALKHIFKD